MLTNMAHERMPATQCCRRGLIDWYASTGKKEKSLLYREDVSRAGCDIAFWI